jgi:hypothetical protein
VGRGGDVLVWWEATLRENRKLIEDDVSTHSWNLIAQLEAENPLDVLDEWLQADHLDELHDHVGGSLRLFLLLGCLRRWSMSRRLRRAMLVCCGWPR